MRWRSWKNEPDPDWNDPDSRMEWFLGNLRFTRKAQRSNKGGMYFNLLFATFLVVIVLLVDDVFTQILNGFAALAMLWKGARYHGRQLGYWDKAVVHWEQAVTEEMERRN